MPTVSLPGRHGRGTKLTSVGVANNSTPAVGLPADAEVMADAANAMAATTTSAGSTSHLESPRLRIGGPFLGQAHLAQRVACLAGLEALSDRGCVVDLRDAGHT